MAMFNRCAGQGFFTAALIVSIAASFATAADQPATQPSARAGVRPPFRWVSSGPVVTVRPDATRQAVAIKDPSVVRFADRWHIYATYATQGGRWGMVYTSFTDWKDAATAPQYFMDENPNLKGYHCAPQVFYFAPQKQWYLVYQSQQPQFSTNADIAKPQDWTKPQNFFEGTPKSVVEGWLDYWIICDDAHAFLFFSDDHGRWYRSRTKLADFPKGFDEPVIVLQEPVARDLFEGGCVYRVKGTNQYIALIEAGNEGWKRYYKAFTADSLDGAWRPLAAAWGASFADTTRIRTEDGSKLWTDDISHGELVRDGYEQTMTIDPANLQLLYQGMTPNRPEHLEYVQLPWQLGLLRVDPEGQKQLSK